MYLSGLSSSFIVIGPMLRSYLTDGFKLTVLALLDGIYKIPYTVSLRHATIITIRQCYAYRYFFLELFLLIFLVCAAVTVSKA